MPQTPLAKTCCSSNQRMEGAMRKTTLMCILFSILFGASPSLARPTVDWAGKLGINLSCGSKIAAWIYRMMARSQAGPIAEIGADPMAPA